MRSSGRRASLGVALFVLLAVAGVGARGAEDYELRAFIEPSGPVTETSQLQLVIQLEGTDLPEVAVTEFPALVNLRILSGPNSYQSTSLRIVGTSQHRIVSKSVLYTLLPERPGIAEIPPVTLKVGATTERTEAIRFEVEPARAGPPPASPGPGQREGRDPGDDSVPVFLEAEAGSEEVWVGEPVTFDVTLYAGTRVTHFNWVEAPSFSNFWVEEVETDSGAEARRTTIEGRPYTAYPVVRKLLVPTTPGEFLLTPYSAQIQVRRASGDFFQDLFSATRSRNIIRKTGPVEIKVRALPAEGVPEGFDGAVGSFRLKVALDREEARVNDAVALKATVEGTGLLRTVRPPRLEATSDLKLFDPKISDSSDVRGGRLRARKSWEWIVVPLTPGELRLPPLTFSYFDPSTGSYETLTGDPGLLVVGRSDEEPEAAVARGEVRLQRKEIAFIKALRGRLADRQPRFRQRAWYLTLLLLPLGLAPVVILVARHRARFLRDHGLARSRRARANARKRLHTAKRQIARADPGRFHEEVARALVEYVADRFNRSASGLTYDVADELLASRDVDAELRRRVRSCLESCDFARYVSSSGQAQRKSELLDEASTLIDALEKSLASGRAAR